MCSGLDTGTYDCRRLQCLLSNFYVLLTFHATQSTKNEFVLDVVWTSQLHAMRIRDVTASKQRERTITVLCMTNKCTEIGVSMKLTLVFLQ